MEAWGFIRAEFLRCRYLSNYHAERSIDRWTAQCDVLARLGTETA